MTRVVIVGAGISGLATAYAVEQLAKQAELEVETLVLEKQQRTGGKIWSIQEEGFSLRMGAERVSRQQADDPRSLPSVGDQRSVAAFGR